MTDRPRQTALLAFVSYRERLLPIEGASARAPVALRPVARSVPQGGGDPLCR